MSLLPLSGLSTTTTSIGLVAIYNKSFRKLFDDAIPMKATVKETSKLMSHPLENGADISDHRVILQTEIEIDMLLQGGQYRSVYQQIKQAFLTGEKLTVTTKTDTYNDMIIESMPHEETSEFYDAIPLFLKLKEAQFVTPQYEEAPISQPSNKSDGKTKDRGQQQPNDATKEEEEKGSTIYKAGKKAKKKIEDIFK
ncbi:hypothetical protein LPW36_01945 [Jinshanibacter sp. LJY008]|uniref:Dit-like phage tail protein N-terminal domain-containing protein n=1 Tax=Limnobaculum eriocheiris TaxID=2897391 RepID=A0A9X1SJF5_9GAMM|nr:hypothetical protein [Limnobaculum eriocheiris]MCD1124806.1 hypothetical protein [Limnobaculum eriocheiris]